MPGDRVHDLCLCASEAATNALKHAGGGEACVATFPTGVRVRVRDQGGGIDHFHLPRATLMRGYSTRASMSGEGTTLIVEMACEKMSEVDQILARLQLGD
jgi:anti-sigma regulatory factor (Ser/Thr protein kinase)